LPHGGVATRSADGGFEYIHVLRPPKSGTTIRLPPTMDGRRFTEAVMLRTGRKAGLKCDEQAVTIEVPWQDAWDPIDTVLKLTGQRGYGNVAAGKVVTTSSAHKDWPAANAVDGEKNRGFSTDGADSPAWIIVDFGKTVMPEQVHLYPRVHGDIVGYNFPVDFAIQVSPDKATWKTLLAKTNYVCTHKTENSDGAISKMDVRDPSANMQVFRLPAPSAARFLRIEATKLKDENRMQFMEIETYGMDPDAQK
jgi:hypothetical protein